MAARIKEIVQKRGNMKAQITNFRKFIEENKEVEVSIENITRRIEKLNKTFEPFEDISDELELLDEERAEEYSTARLEIQESYFKVLDAADEIKKRGASRDQIIMPVRNEIVNNSSNRVTKRRIKLPDAILPTFNGKYEDWLAFKDGFTSMIDSQEDLSNIEKLQYLKSSLSGEAEDKIKTLNITDDNYQRAWTILKKAYADDRLIISKHLNLILSLPVQHRESADGLRKLADDTQQHVESLSSLGVNVTEEILVQNLENKLYETTADKWGETLERDVFPLLEKMLEFLYKNVARLSKRDSENSDKMINEAEYNKGIRS